MRFSATHSAPDSSTTTSTSRMPRSSAFRPRSRIGNSANISRCFEAQIGQHCASAITVSPSPLVGEGGATEHADPTFRDVSLPKKPMLQLGLSDQLLRRPAPYRASALDDVMAVGDA